MIPDPAEVHMVTHNDYYKKEKINQTDILLIPVSNHKHSNQHFSIYATSNNIQLLNKVNFNSTLLPAMV